MKGVTRIIIKTGKGFVMYADNPTGKWSTEGQIRHSKTRYQETRIDLRGAWGGGREW